MCTNHHENSTVAANVNIEFSKQASSASLVDEPIMQTSVIDTNNVVDESNPKTSISNARDESIPKACSTSAVAVGKFLPKAV